MRNPLRQLLGLISDIYYSRRLILELTFQDIKARYLGSYLGILWAFIQPTATILILWFVFEVGFKAATVDNFPFVLWLITGMVPWFFVADSISGATGSIVESSYLVSKVVFRVSILPIIKILASLTIHLFFVLFVVLMFYVYNYPLSVYYLQIVYYLAAMLVLVTGLSWITSSLVIFLKDIGQAVAMLLQFGFWLTPIFWPVNSIPERFQGIVKINPFCYLVEGYRTTFIWHRWFWEDGTAALSFWMVTLTIFFLGAIIFRRLRPH
ncbi:MAG: ABC transporter permease, partial [Negativicutes bacterium]|nr:ABC transporter permease [Negativicutes bacterium]